MSERATVKDREAFEAAKAADAYIDYRKNRTTKWLRRGFNGTALSVVSLALAFGTITFPPVGIAFVTLALGAAAYGAGSTAIGIGSGISNKLRGI